MSRRSTVGGLELAVRGLEVQTQGRLPAPGEDWRELLPSPLSGKRWRKHFSVTCTACYLILWINIVKREKSDQTVPNWLIQGTVKISVPTLSLSVTLVSMVQTEPRRSFNMLLHWFSSVQLQWSCGEDQLSARKTAFSYRGSRAEVKGAACLCPGRLGY